MLEPTVSTPAPAPAAAAPAPEANKPAEGSKPGAPTERMYKVKVNGKEEEWPESKVLERASKAEGAEAAMKKAAELEKAFNNFVSSTQDPEKLLGLLQHPALKYDEAKQEVLVTKLLSSKSPRVVQAVKKWLYDNEIAPAMMDPKERELQELRAEKERLAKEAEERKSKEEETAKQVAVAKKWNEFRIAIGEALKAENLPQAEGVVARVARYALLQRRMNKPVDLAEAAKRVKADLSKEYDDRFKGLNEDNILDHIPAGVAELINKAFLKRAKKDANPTLPGATAPVAESNAPSLDETLRAVGRGKKVFQD